MGNEGDSVGVYVPLFLQNHFLPPNQPWKRCGAFPHLMTTSLLRTYNPTLYHRTCRIPQLRPHLSQRVRTEEVASSNMRMLLPSISEESITSECSSQVVEKSDLRKDTPAAEDESAKEHLDFNENRQSSKEDQEAAMDPEMSVVDEEGTNSFENGEHSAHSDGLRSIYLSVETDLDTKHDQFGDCVDEDVAVLASVENIKSSTETSYEECLSEDGTLEADEVQDIGEIDSGYANEAEILEVLKDFENVDYSAIASMELMGNSSANIEEFQGAVSINKPPHSDELDISKKEFVLFEISFGSHTPREEQPKICIENSEEQEQINITIDYFDKTLMTIIEDPEFSESPLLVSKTNVPNFSENEERNTSSSLTVETDGSQSLKLDLDDDELLNMEVEKLTSRYQWASDDEVDEYYWQTLNEMDIIKNEEKKIVPRDAYNAKVVDLERLNVLGTNTGSTNFSKVVEGESTIVETLSFKRESSQISLAQSETEEEIDGESNVFMLNFENLPESELSSFRKSLEELLLEDNTLSKAVSTSSRMSEGIEEAMESSNKQGGINSFRSDTSSQLFEFEQNLIHSVREFSDDDVPDLDGWQRLISYLEMKGLKEGEAIDKLKALLSNRDERKLVSMGKTIETCNDPEDVAFEEASSRSLIKATDFCDSATICNSTTNDMHEHCKSTINQVSSCTESSSSREECRYMPQSEEEGQHKEMKDKCTGSGDETEEVAALLNGGFSNDETLDVTGDGPPNIRESENVIKTEHTADITQSVAEIMEQGFDALTMEIGRKEIVTETLATPNGTTCKIQDIIEEDDEGLVRFDGCRNDTLPVAGVSKEASTQTPEKIVIEDEKDVLKPLKKPLMFKKTQAIATNIVSISLVEPSGTTAEFSDQAKNPIACNLTNTGNVERQTKHAADAFRKEFNEKSNENGVTKSASKNAKKPIEKSLKIQYRKNAVKDSPSRDLILAKPANTFALRNRGQIYDKKELETKMKKEADYKFASKLTETRNPSSKASENENYNVTICSPEYNEKFEKVELEEWEKKIEEAILKTPVESLRKNPKEQNPESLRKAIKRTPVKTPNRTLVPKNESTTKSSELLAQDTSKTSKNESDSQEATVPNEAKCTQNISEHKKVVTEQRKQNKIVTRREEQQVNVQTEKRIGYEEKREQKEGATTEPKSIQFSEEEKPKGKVEENINEPKEQKSLVEKRSVKIQVSPTQSRDRNVGNRQILSLKPRGNLSPIPTMRNITESDKTNDARNDQKEAESVVAAAQTHLKKKFVRTGLTPSKGLSDKTRLVEGKTSKTPVTKRWNI